MQYTQNLKACYERAREKMEKQLGVTEAREKFSEMIEKVQYQRDAYVISRHGKPAAAVVPIEVYESWKREREKLFDTLRTIQEENQGESPDEVMRDVLEAQQAVRKK